MVWLVLAPSCVGTALFVALGFVLVAPPCYRCLGLGLWWCLSRQWTPAVARYLLSCGCRAVDLLVGLGRLDGCRGALFWGCGLAMFGRGEGFARAGRGCVRLGDL